MSNQGKVQDWDMGSMILENCACAELLIWLPIVLTTTILTKIIYCRYFHPLRHIPGPFLASFTRLWLIGKSCSWNIHRVELELHQRYGSIVRVSPDEIRVADPRHLKLIYGAGTQFSKAPWYEALRDPNPASFSLLGELDVAKYRYQRRLIRPTFSLQTVKEQESYMDNAMRRYVEKMRALAEQPQDLVKWMHILSTDLLTETTFGESPRLINSGAEGKSSKAMDDFWKEVFIMGHSVWLMKAQRFFTRSQSWRYLKQMLGLYEPNISNANIFQVRPSIISYHLMLHHVISYHYRRSPFLTQIVVPSANCDPEGRRRTC